MEKINIAEILKDCPLGMELDSTNYDGVVKFEGFNKNNPYSIRIVVAHDGVLTAHSLTKYGQTSISSYNKCVIFPKGKTTWKGFIPPGKFKDGDILFVNSAYNWIIIYKESKKEEDLYKYVAISVSDHTNHTYMVYDNNPLCYKEDISKIRLATEEEKEKLFKAIKDNGHKWNAVTKTLEKLDEPKFKVGDKIQQKNQHEVCLVSEVRDNHYLLDEKDIALPFFAQDDWELAPDKFDITTLKPFDWVLVRLDNCNQWYATLFSHIDERQESFCRRYVTVSGKSYTQMIPYEGNESLCGTKDDCEEFYKTWENEGIHNCKL